MRSPRRAARPAAAAIAALPLLAACAGPAPEGGRAALRETFVGPTLERLWDSTGGTAWERIGSLRFTYTAEPGPAAGVLAAALGVPASPQAPGPLEVQVDDRDGGSLRARGPDGWQDLDPPGGRRTLESWALRSARALLELPRELRGPWEFSVCLVGGEEPDPWSFTAFSRDPSFPHRAYRVEVDPASGLPRSILYQVAGDRGAGAVFEVVPGGWREVGGVRVPTELVHLALGRHGSARYPWEPERGARDPGGAASRGEVVLRETIRDLEVIPAGVPRPAVASPALADGKPGDRSR